MKHLVSIFVAISSLSLFAGCGTFIEREFAVQHRLTPYKRQHWEGNLSRRELIEHEERIRSIPHIETTWHLPEPNITFLDPIFASGTEDTQESDPTAEEM